MNDKLKTIFNLINKTLMIIAVALMFTVLCYVLYYNISNNDNFWISSIVEILTIIIALIFAYYLVEKNNNKRKQKEIIQSNIKKIQHYIYDSEIYNVQNNTIANSLTRKIKIRKINNLLSYLKDYSEKYKYKKILKKITSDFKDYQRLSEEMIQDNDFNTKSINSLIRIIETIDDNLEEIIHLIYLR